MLPGEAGCFARGEVGGIIRATAQNPENVTSRGDTRDCVRMTC
jgi:hypothetical protein